MRAAGRSFRRKDASVARTMFSMELSRCSTPFSLSSSAIWCGDCSCGLGGLAVVVFRSGGLNRAASLTSTLCLRPVGQTVLNQVYIIDLQQYDRFRCDK